MTPSRCLRFPQSAASLSFLRNGYFFHPRTYDFLLLPQVVFALFGCAFLRITGGCLSRRIFNALEEDRKEEDGVRGQKESELPAVARCAPAERNLSTGLDSGLNGLGGREGREGEEKRRIFFYPVQM